MQKNINYNWVEKKEGNSWKGPDIPRFVCLCRNTKLEKRKKSFWRSLEESCKNFLVRKSLPGAISTHFHSPFFTKDSFPLIQFVQWVKVLKKNFLPIALEALIPQSVNLWWCKRSLWIPFYAQNLSWFIFGIKISSTFAASSTAVFVKLTPLLGALMGVVGTLILVVGCIVVCMKMRRGKQVTFLICIISAKSSTFILFILSANPTPRIFPKCQRENC